MVRFSIPFIHADNLSHVDVSAYYTLNSRNSLILSFYQIISSNYKIYHINRLFIEKSKI